MSKQTAVEWLVEQLLANALLRLTKDEHSVYKELKEQAKAMEIDQMEEAFHESRLTKDFCVYLNSGFKHESFYAYYYEGGEQ
jgi:hypothetical protein